MFIIIVLLIFLYYYNVKDNSTNMVKILVRQSARWATASQQDTNAMVAVLHANYGAGDLWALKDIFTENQINKVVNLKKFEHEIVKTQDMATKKMIQACPKYGPNVVEYCKAGLNAVESC